MSYRGFRSPFHHFVVVLILKNPNLQFAGGLLLVNYSELSILI